MPFCKIVIITYRYGYCILMNNNQILFTNTTCLYKNTFFQFYARLCERIRPRCIVRAAYNYPGFMNRNSKSAFTKLISDLNDDMDCSR